MRMRGQMPIEWLESIRERPGQVVRIGKLVEFTLVRGRAQISRDLRAACGVEIA
jgi:hypothetical protein